jgi:rRNA maturation protein Nop10
MNVESAIKQIAEYYTVEAHCTNCGNEPTIVVKKGTQKPETDVCPKCRCFTLSTKIWS